MLTPSLTSADYLHTFRALISHGRVWPRDQGATQTQVLSGLVQVHGRQIGCSNYLLADSFPGTACELPLEWESALGLPDPYVREPPTAQQKRARVVTRLASGDGQSTAYYIGSATELGHEIMITNFAPFCYG